MLLFTYLDIPKIKNHSFFTGLHCQAGKRHHHQGQDIHRHGENEWLSQRDGEL